MAPATPVPLIAGCVTLVSEPFAGVTTTGGASWQACATVQVAPAGQSAVNAQRTHVCDVVSCYAGLHTVGEFWILATVMHVDGRLEELACVSLWVEVRCGTS